MSEAKSEASELSAVLERCPFCGGEAAFGKTTYSSKTIREQNWGQDTFHSVNCISCGTSNRGLVGYRTTEESADALAVTGAWCVGDTCPPTMTG